MPYDAKTERLPIFTLFDLKGDGADLARWAPMLKSLPAAPNTLTETDGIAFCHTGPNRWLLRAPIDREAELTDTLRPETAPPEISIVHVSDTLTFFRFTGPDAGEVMSIGCPLDLHRDAFDKNAVSYTEFFGLKALVLRCPGGFDCAVEQSFGDMIEDYLARAMA